MTVVIVGPGALGTLLAASLLAHSDNRKNHRIWLLDHNANRAAQLQRDGLTMKSGAQTIHCPVLATADPAEPGPADLVLVCVKSHQLAETFDNISLLCHPQSLAVLLQNGIGHLQYAPEIPATVAAGVTTLGATLVAPGHVRYAGAGITRLGLLSRHTGAGENHLLETASLLTECGIECHAVKAIEPFVWAKLMINVGINALTAIHNCPNGRLIENRELLTTMTAAVEEARAVAQALGINGLEDAVNSTIAVCRGTAANISSMLQDVRNGKTTEIDSINGAIIRLAEKQGVAVPINRRLFEQVKEIENHYG